MRVIPALTLIASLAFVTEGFAASGAAQPPRKGGEQRMEMAAERVPGFAGLYYDVDGTLTVKLVGTAGVDAARQHFGSDVRIHNATYTFVQLQAWRDRARQILRLPKVVSIDLNEQQNRIVIAIDELANAHERSSVFREIESFHLPEGAVVVETTEAAQDVALLTDDIRPQPSGVEIGASPSGVCTLGFNVSFEAGEAFITCAHCTSVRGQVDGDFVGWGVEVRDIPYWTGGVCPTGRWCRYSDSALIHYAFVVEQGAGEVIARPDARGNPSCPSSITIDGSSPELNITGTDDSPVMNQDVDKIGRSTGWTYGTVTDTCIDLNVTAMIDGVSRNLTYICVHEANTKLSPGDSGAPVFAWDGEDGATLMGMIFAGGSNCSTHAYWADVDAIHYELGPYNGG